MAGLRLLYPGVPPSGVPPSDGGLTIVSKLAHAGADIDELRFLYGGRLLDGISSAIAINSSDVVGTSSLVEVTML